ncbi:MAG: HEPN domain-containing protein [Defluviitaleaceae bacterium]|nr:HEPN domain-containing protein [Defluviitaleaceae bacterium]
MSDLAAVAEWLKFAERDYEIALHLSKTFHPLPVENICYNCQQATEKAIKGILILHKGDYPRTHDIESLHELCKEAGTDFGLTLSMTRTLTRFAKNSRYPDDVIEFSETDTEIGLKYAKRILNQARGVLDKVKKEAEKSESPK